VPDIQIYNHEIIGRNHRVGSTDLWGIRFAPSPLDREPFDAPTSDRQVGLLRAAWAEFDEMAAGVSAELRPGVRGGGRSRDPIVRHVQPRSRRPWSRSRSEVHAARDLRPAPGTDIKGAGSDSAAPALLL